MRYLFFIILFIGLVSIGFIDGYARGYVRANKDFDKILSIYPGYYWIDAKGLRAYSPLD